MNKFSNNESSTNGRLKDILTTIVDTLRYTHVIQGFVKKDSTYYTVTLSDLDDMVNSDVGTVSGTTNFNGTYELVAKNISNLTVDIAKAGTYLTETGSLKNAKPFLEFTYLPDAAREIMEKGYTRLTKLQKYPLILVDAMVEETRSINPMILFECTLNVYIICPTEIKYNKVERITNVFEPILYPLYDRFYLAMKNSRKFNLDSKNIIGEIDHKKTDLFFYGTKDQNQLCDVVDAIELNFAKLEILNI
jgi:hypothetical protein